MSPNNTTLAGSKKQHVPGDGVASTSKKDEIEC